MPKNGIWWLAFQIVNFLEAQPPKQGFPTLHCVCLSNDSSDLPRRAPAALAIDRRNGFLRSLGTSKQFGPFAALIWFMKNPVPWFDRCHS